MSLTSYSSPDKAAIQSIFNQIAVRYDFLNTFLSLNFDEGWRKRAFKLIFEGHEESILDLGIGTGRFLEPFLKAKRWNLAAGLDFSSLMLSQSRKQVPDYVKHVSADFHDLPFQSETFDLVISAFTLRSVKDLPRFFNENYRIMKPGGKLAMLCLTRPSSFLAKLAYYPYLKIYIPLMGRLVSGSDNAYRFLSESIQHFQDPDLTMNVMKEQGFTGLRKKTFTLGAATLIMGRKP